LPHSPSAFKTEKIIEFVVFSLHFSGAAAAAAAAAEEEEQETKDSEFFFLNFFFRNCQRVCSLSRQRRASSANRLPGTRQSCTCRRRS